MYKKVVAHTHNSVLALTSNYSVKGEYPAEWIKHSLTNECPNHDIVRHANIFCIKFSPTQSFASEWQDRHYQCPGSHYTKSKSNLPRWWEHNILSYRVLNAEINIILLHWNKQHLESVIIKGGCRLLDQNFHLVLMFTCFATIHGFVRVESWAVRSIFWQKMSQHLHSKQTSARGGNASTLNGFLNFSSTSFSAILRLASSSRSMS